MAIKEEMYQFTTPMGQGLSTYSEDVQYVNLYQMATPNARSQAQLVPISGTDTVTTATPDNGTGCRGAFSASTGPDGLSVKYIVYGNTLYRIKEDLSLLRIGNIASSDTKCTFAENQDQTVKNTRGFVCDGVIVFEWDLKASDATVSTTFKEIGQVPFVNGSESTRGIVSYISYSNYRLILTMANSTQWFYSDLNSSFVPHASFESTESSPDKTIRVEGHGNNLWALSRYSYDIFSATNVDSNPFDVSTGASGKVGCVSGDSVAKVDQYMFFLGQSLGGNSSSVYMVSTTGQIEKITSAGIENIIRQWKHKQYTKGLAYSDLGHTFYVLTSKFDDYTLVYCVETKTWHRRSTSIDGKLHYWDIIEVISGYDGDLLIATNNSNILGKFNYTRCVDHSGRPITRIFQSPIFIANTDTFTMIQCKVDIECGTSTSYTAKPEIYLQFKWDGKWSGRFTRDLGRMGNYKKQISMYGCGGGKNLVILIGTSAEIPTILYQIRMTLDKGGRV